jgi:hypothetical protein
MEIAGHVCGGGTLLKKYKVGVTFTYPGIATIGTAAAAGVLVATTTSFADSNGLALDTAVYATSQSATGANVEGLVTVDARPDAIVKALMSGAATESTVLPTITNTSASTTGTVVTATVSANDMDSGTIWCVSGANVGQNRVITTHTSTTSFTVTVPFNNDIAVGDQFLYIPYSLVGSGAGGVDGVANLGASTLLYQADASVASGTGGDVAMYDLELAGASNSFAYFLLADHIFGGTPTL